MHHSAYQAAGPHIAQGSELAFAFCMIALLFGLIFVALRAQRGERRALRLCPVCGAVAVRSQAAEDLRGGLACLRLQCGQCGTWRRAVATVAKVETHERALMRDRRRIDHEALRWTRRDVEAFTRALRHEVVGADDFLACARSALPRGRS